MSLKNLEPFIKCLCLLAVGATAYPLDRAGAAESGPINLGWDADPTLNSQAYRVYVGTQSGQYSQTYNAGIATSMPIEHLQLSQTYYFAVVAIGSTGLESLPSAELVLTPTLPPLPAGGTLIADPTGGLRLQWSFPTSALEYAPTFLVQASPDMVNWTQVATVLAAASQGAVGGQESFSWPISTTGGVRMFYRLTSKNLFGQASTN